MDGGASNKRKRLNHACDRCRARKVRCDDLRPYCTNCVKANATCTTRDPRNPSAAVVRHEAQLPPNGSSSIARSQTAQTVLSPQGATPSITSPSNHSTRASIIEKESENDVQSPGQGSAAGRLPAFPRFINGNSLYILTQWLDLAFVRLHHSFRFSHIYQKAKPAQTHASTVKSHELDLLGTVEQQDTFLRNFLQNIHPVFPLLSSEYWEDVTAQQVDARSVRAILRLLLVAMSLGRGAREALDRAFSMLNLLIQSSTLESVVALIFMIIAFRGQDDSETAQHLLSVTNSIASTMQLHRALPDQTADHIRAWWTLYALDKILAIELERPASIRTVDCNQVDVEKELLLYSIVELSKIQERIIERVFQQRGLEESNDKTLEQIIEHKMRMAGEHDNMLVEWHANLQSKHSISEHLICEPEDLPAVAFLAIQYYQTLFSIHRNGLITNSRHIRDLADTTFQSECFRLRLRTTSLISYGTAKSIVTILGQLYDCDCQSILHTTYTPLIAAVVLAIYIYKHPTTTTAKVNLELLSSAITFIERRSSNARQNDQSPGLCQLLRSLQADLISRVQRSMEMPQSVHEAFITPPIADGTHQSNMGSNELGSAFPEYPSFAFDENTNLPSALDFHFPANDVPNWSEFLQLLDLPGDLVAN